jgi:4-hydroxy-2-oxoheptanedioate aldolase
MVLRKDEMKLKFRFTLKEVLPMNPLRHLTPRFRGHRLTSAVIVTIAVIAELAMPVRIELAQQAPVHLNPAVEKLAQGQPIIGIQTDDMSLQNCHSLARVDFDYAYVDMEHGPLNLDGLASCVAAMVDKAAVLKKGNAQVKVALFARFPPYGRDLESYEWIAKQALDMGLMGIIFNGVDNKEQMTGLIQSMRYPQPKNSEYQQPPGLRGFSPGNAVFAWGISQAEYERHADVWPLNPLGDLLAIPMIETAEGLKNVNEIASVPGVGAIFVGAGGDLHQYLGVAQNSADVEQAFQTILAACKAHNVACGITATTKADMDNGSKKDGR